MDEQLNNLELNDEQEKADRSEQRFRNLTSEKAKLAADKAEADRAKAEAEAKVLAAAKDVEFYKNFNTTASKYPNAGEYQDKIREKVLAGYDLEDATISILAKEGKLQAAPAPKPSSPAGGSAPTNLTSGEKTLTDMNRSEKRAQLEEAVRRGDIALS